MPTAALLPAALAVLAGSLSALVPAPAGAAAIYGFSCLRASGGFANCAAAAAQVTMHVVDAGANRVLFRFENTGLVHFAITEIYFDDGTLLGIAAIQDNPAGGVDFRPGASPPNLPGAGNLNPVFETSSSGANAFSAEPVPHPPHSGVNPGEQVGILFNLLANRTYADTIAALDIAGGTGGLRAQAFTDGGSISMVNGATPVPVPAAAPLLLLGLAGLAAAVRRRTRLSAVAG